eukprot:638327-Rhodomonas_salina.3
MPASVQRGCALRMRMLGREGSSDRVRLRNKTPGCLDLFARGTSYIRRAAAQVLQRPRGFAAAAFLAISCDKLR